MIKAFVGGVSGSGGEGGNPLKRRVKEIGYEGTNRDSGGATPFYWGSERADGTLALRVLHTMVDTPSSAPTTSTRPFVYISAADAFRPLVPARYIETKRQAELEIARRCCENPDVGVRPVFIRPGEWLSVLSGYKINMIER